MRKRKWGAALLCAALLAALLPAAAQAEGVTIDETNFPDAAFREYVSNFDLDPDNVLSPDEIKAVTIMLLVNCDITSLKGIEYFTALTYLYCPYNVLTELDVSKNTALTELRCSYNALTELDVTKNTALTTLDCSDNNLTALNVSQNTALTNLDCSRNALTELDVSQNTKLTSLICQNTALTALNVSKNTALTNLDCSHNDLTALDVSQNTALTYLDCNNNALTALDLSQNTKLTYLNCSGQQAAETRVLQQADGSGRADLSSLVPGWPGAQGVQVQGGTLEADGSTVAWDGKTSPVTVSYAYRTGYQAVTMDAMLHVYFDSGSRPVFTQPAGAQTVTVQEGETGVLRAAATDALVYQWYVNRNDGAGYVAVSGATGATYTTSAATVENDGYTYYCEATNAFGTTSSPVFTLRVTAEPVPETGDGSDPALWLTLALLSLCGLGALTFGRRRGAARR